jgi:hypothetical protein
VLTRRSNVPDPGLGPLLVNDVGPLEVFLELLGFLYVPCGMLCACAAAAVGVCGTRVVCVLHVYACACLNMCVCFCGVCV